MTNVFDSAQAPYCSLDPKPENIRRLNYALSNKDSDFETTIRNCRNAIGGQQVVVGGVPKNSRHAKIMIYTDYEMKKLSQGLSRLPGIRSCIDIAAADHHNSFEKGSSMSRFWFHIKESVDNKIYPNYIENEGIVFINECPVVVLTEKQESDAEGHTKDNASVEDPDAEAFAADMSRNYANLAKENELFAELENMFRLQACCRSIRFREELPSSNGDLMKGSGIKLTGGEYLPAELPGLINYKTFETHTDEKDKVFVDSRLYLVCGGVSQEMKVNIQHFLSVSDISKAREIIISSKPAKVAVSWICRIQF
jgi:hypothetical protein